MDVVLEDPKILAVLLLPVAIIVLLLGYYLSGAPMRRHRHKMEVLQRAYHREENPRQRYQLMREWSEMGGHRHGRKDLERRQDKDMGQRARADGLPRSANPYRSSWWGRGRAWHDGWRTVDRNIRWIHSHR